MQSVQAAINSEGKNRNSQENWNKAPALASANVVSPISGVSSDVKAKAAILNSKVMLTKNASSTRLLDPSEADKGPAVDAMAGGLGLPQSGQSFIAEKHEESKRLQLDLAEGSSIGCVCACVRACVGPD